MVRNILSDIFSSYSSFGKKCQAAFLVLLTLTVVGLLGLLGFILVDSAGNAPTKTAVTLVEGKQILPAYVTTTLVGKVTNSQRHPESYRLHFKIDGEAISSAVEKKFFDNVNIGDKIEVDYGFGRLNNSRQPTQIRLAAR